MKCKLSSRSAVLESAQAESSLPAAYSRGRSISTHRPTIAPFTGMYLGARYRFVQRCGRRFAHAPE